MIPEHGRGTVVAAIRAELEQLRTKIACGGVTDAELEAELSLIPEQVANGLHAAHAPSLRRVINATGVLLHTNLGRAPLSQEALAHIAECSSGYSNLEFDLAQGARGRRDDHLQPCFTQLLARHGIEDQSSLVVNNNAAAVLLALSALAEGGEVIVSRGELVEIGGSFRVPEIMAQSGAVLREVGTTNRTRTEDYKNAINERTRIMLRVHRSNFAIVGFTEQPSLSELAELARECQVLCVEDLGSGALLDLKPYGIAGEPNVFASLRAGFSLVTFSCDKLLGGPQPGAVICKPELIEQMRKHPLFRALRVDKLCYSALEATLAAYAREHFDSIPVLRMLGIAAEEIGRRCESLAATASELSIDVEATETMIGGGAAPGKSIPSFALLLCDLRMSAGELARQLRQQRLPIIGRIEQDRVLLDLRTVDPKDDAYIARVLKEWSHSDQAP